MLIFVPSKTELAKQMGDFLNVPFTLVDCAQMRNDWSMFGSVPGYVGNERGSQLSNHLKENCGVTSVVVLDEFDKMVEEVQNSLLLLLDSGEYHNRRDNTKVDASKTIWILASNTGSDIIAKFYADHLKGEDYTTQAKAPEQDLISKLKRTFLSTLGAPMAGRMKKVIPFVPFDLGEQAVVAHKFLLELVDQVRIPIDVAESVKHYTGHMHLEIKADGELCKKIATESFISEIGARSIQTAVDDIRSDLYAVFADSDEAVGEEMNAGPLAKYTIKLNRAHDNAGEIEVCSDGFTEYYTGQQAQGDGEATESTRAYAVDNLAVDERGKHHSQIAKHKHHVKVNGVL